MSAPAAVQVTAPVSRWRATDLGDLLTVALERDLVTAGISRSTTHAHLRAGRWQRIGRAIVLHNGPLSREDRERAYLISCGSRSALTSFSAAVHWGLRGWEREQIHLLVPAGVRDPRLPGLVLHRVVDWGAEEIAPARPLHQLAPALLVGAGAIVKPRIACALLAAGVQQRLVQPAKLLAALDRQPKLRHHRAMRLALHDIEQGSHALSELDFVRLCRHHRIPAPDRQRIRPEPSGRRRYMDAEWDLPGGRTVAAEVDGAVHLHPETWAADQLRQNEVAIARVPVLRFPSVVIRTEAALVADQLRRMFAAYG